MSCHCQLCRTPIHERTNPVPHEIEYNDGTGWQRDGFQTIAGFNPWRYERKEDAAYSVQSRHPGMPTRVVPAQAVREEK